MELNLSKEEFCKLAKLHNIIPVYTKVSVDMETPVSIYYKLVGDAEGYILESADTSNNFGRYSFIGAEPFAKFTARKHNSQFILNSKVTEAQGAPLENFDKLLKQFSCPVEADLPPFIGGAVGYFSYESVATWERIRGMKVDDNQILAEQIFCKVIFIMDHLTHSGQLIYLAQIEGAAETKEVYEQAKAELTALIKKIEQPAIFEEDDVSIIGAHKKVDKQGFIKKVEQAKEYIAAGDIFQVVLSQQFHYKLKGQPFLLYRKLRQVNPSHYMFYINFGERKLIGASPEMLVKLHDNKVTTYPIAGTRPRGITKEQDEKLALELLSDDKEKAEHAMLVDLGRNDLGRISIPGTVEVERTMKIEKFSHVMHMVSEITGVIEPRYTAVDALKACFPAGTLSGAPKVRAMEIINELEKLERGPYAGAVGYFDLRGNMDTCIAIRTMVVDGDVVKIQAGAGIVADSIPENEYIESLNKAKALFSILGEEAGYDFNN